MSDAREITGLAEVVAPGGRALLVVNRSGRSLSLLKESGARVEPFTVGDFTILEASWPTEL